MANNFENTDLVTKIAVKEFLNSLMFADKVDRQFENKFNKVGETINARRPIMFEATSGATINAGDTSDITEATFPITLDRREKVVFEVSSQDMTLEVTDMTERYIKPAMEELAQKVDIAIANSYKNIANFSGTAGTTPGTFRSVAEANNLLTKIGAPITGKCLFVDPDAGLELADGLRNTFTQPIAKKAIEEAMVGRYAKWDIYESNNIAIHTVGSLAGTPVVDGADQNTDYADTGGEWRQTITTGGWTAGEVGVLKHGDVFTLGVNSVNRRNRMDTGSLQTFVVLGDVDADAAGNATFEISPPIITDGAYQTVMEAPADAEPLVILTGAAGESHRQNLGFHKDAITLAVSKLDMPMKGTARSSSQSFKNVSIRTVVDHDFNRDVNMYRFDILFGVKEGNPDFAVRLTG